MSTVKLITEHGTFESDSIAGIEKDLRKAKREEKKRNAEIAANGTLANTRAAANGFHLLHRFLVDGKPPRGWRYYAAGHKYGPKLREHRDCAERLYHEAFYETQCGSVWADHYGHVVLGNVWDGGGHTLCIFLQDNQHPEKLYCLAPGIAGDQLRTVELPGITIDVFDRHGCLSDEFCEYLSKQKGK